MQPTTINLAQAGYLEPKLHTIFNSPVARARARGLKDIQKALQSLGLIPAHAKLSTLSTGVDAAGQRVIVLTFEQPNTVEAAR